MAIDTNHRGGGVDGRCGAFLGGLVAAVLFAGVAPAGEPAVRPAPKLDIGFRNIPDPPRSGKNSVEVTLKLADGTTVDDAQVAVVYYMPAMPSMNMPEMKTRMELQPAGKGIYRGGGSLVMRGTWNVTITATQAGKPLGTRKLSVIAK
jgi:hypothetical protein